MLGPELWNALPDSYKSLKHTTDVFERKTSAIYQHLLKIIHLFIRFSYTVYLFFILFHFRKSVIPFSAQKMAICVILSPSDLLMGRRVDRVV